MCDTAFKNKSHLLFLVISLLIKTERNSFGYQMMERIIILPTGTLDRYLRGWGHNWFLKGDLGKIKSNSKIIAGMRGRYRACATQKFKAVSTSDMGKRAKRRGYLMKDCQFQLLTLGIVGVNAYLELNRGCLWTVSTCLELHGGQCSNF